MSRIRGVLGVDVAATVEAGAIVLDARFVIGRAMITHPPSQQSTMKKREREMRTMNNNADAIVAANMTLLLTMGSIYRRRSRSEARRCMYKCQGHPVEWDYCWVGWTSSMAFLLISHWPGRRGGGLGGRKRAYTARRVCLIAGRYGSSSGSNHTS